MSLPRIMFLLFYIFLILLNVASAAENATPPSASVELHGEKTDVVLGEDIVMKLSAVNIITKPVMTVQVILIPPSGMSVTSSEFVTSGAGQFTSTYNISTGDVRDIEVRIKTNQAGNFEVRGRVIYYFGNNQSTAEDRTLSLPITVRPPPPTPAVIEKITGMDRNAQMAAGALIILLIIIIFLLRKRAADADARMLANVRLYGEKTEVVMGEDIVLKLSVANLITKPDMTVQVIISPPSGMSVTSSEFVASGAGQFTTTYTVPSGAAKDLEVRIKPNQAGDFEVKGRVVYYFSKDRKNTKDQALALPVKVLPGENEYERAAKIAAAEVRSKQAVRSEVLEFERQQKIKDAETERLIEQKESEADFEEARRGIEAYRMLKQAKAEGKKDVPDQEGDDKVTTIKMGRSGSININGAIIQRSVIGAETKKCPHCGAMVPKYAGFCGECGAKLNQDVDL